jgi:hypothetical protein
MNKFSLSGYAENSKYMFFYCKCKQCDNKSTAFISPSEYLDIAYVLVASDMLTKKEFKQLNHLAVSQWDFIAQTYGGKL